jgi:transposase
MVVLSVAIKLQIVQELSQGRITTREAATLHNVSIRSIQKFVQKTRKGIPLHSRIGRPRSLDNDLFSVLVEYSAGLPVENRVYNPLLNRKYRQLSTETYVRRVLEVNNQVDNDEIYVPYSRRTRRRYCNDAVAQANVGN